jgi:Flp pilus assembly protein TadG
MRGLTRKAFLRYRRDARGQALVEFALTIPLLLLMLFGILEFARAWNTYQVITDAAREAARTAVVANSEVTIDSVNAVITHALGRAGLNSAAATTSVDGFRAGTGIPAQVNISYPFQFRGVAALMGWTGQDASIQLRTSIVMRNE